MARHLSVIVILAVAAFLSLMFLTSFGDRHDPVPQAFTAPGGGSHSSDSKSSVSGASPPVEPAPESLKEGSQQSKLPALAITDDILKGGAIAPKLENATIKAELGRSSWRLLHTMMAKFPEKPTPDDALALATWIQLFARLYPCGDCAAHFQKVLEKYPPQTSSRNAAAGWACFVHNVVNERLHHPIFDCTKIGDFYDCGCGDDKKKDEAADKSESSSESSSRLSSASDSSAGELKKGI